MKTIFPHLAVTFALVLNCSALAEGAAVHVSVAKLLQSPEEFDGKRVTVSGFYVTAYEHSALYIDQKEFWRESDKTLFERSIWIEFTDQRAEPGKIAVVDNDNVQVTGTFRYRPEHIMRTQLGFGNNGAWAMQIHKLTGLKPVGKKATK